MDILVFDIQPVNWTAATDLLLQNARIQQNIKSSMWIERYRDASEFKLVLDYYGLARYDLEIGSYISHIRTGQVMQIENHEITESKDSGPQLTVSGRGLEVMLDERVVGFNKAYPSTAPIVDFALTTGYTPDQAVELIKKNIDAAYVPVNDSLPHLKAMNLAVRFDPSYQSGQRFVSRGGLYERLIEFLQIDDLGLYSSRPGRHSSNGVYDTDIWLVVHNGLDKSDSVILSVENDQLDNADYLWSAKGEKNQAIVTGRWVEVRTGSDSSVPTQSQRKMIQVDGTGIDNSYSAAPTGAALTTVVAQMTQRGLDAVAASNRTTVMKVEALPNSQAFVYRRDYDIGDIVLVKGKYDVTQKMRVTEYVEIDDDSGPRGYPTLVPYP